MTKIKIMEREEEKKKEGVSSYRYWVREATADAAPPPLPQKLTNNDVAPNAPPPALGSLWNQVLLFCFASLLYNSSLHSLISSLVSVGWHLGGKESHQMGN